MHGAFVPAFVACRTPPRPLLSSCCANRRLSDATSPACRCDQPAGGHHQAQEPDLPGEPQCFLYKAQMCHPRAGALAEGQGPGGTQPVWVQHALKRIAALTPHRTCCRYRGCHAGRVRLPPRLPAQPAVEAVGAAPPAPQRCEHMWACGCGSCTAGLCCAHSAHHTARRHKCAAVTASSVWAPPCCP